MSLANQKPNQNQKPTPGKSMPDSRFDLSGANFNQALSDVIKVVEGNVREMAEVTTEYAKDGSPKLTGHNAAGITWEEYEPGRAIIITTSGYGGYLELMHKTKRGYIRRGFEQASREVGNRMENSV